MLLLRLLCAKLQFLTVLFRRLEVRAKGIQPDERVDPGAVAMGKGVPSPMPQMIILPMMMTRTARAFTTMRRKKSCRKGGSKYIPRNGTSSFTLTLGQRNLRGRGRYNENMIVTSPSNGYLFCCAMRWQLKSARDAYSKLTSSVHAVVVDCTSTKVIFFATIWSTTWRNVMSN